MSFRAFDVCMSLMREEDGVEMLHLDLNDDTCPDYRNPEYLKMEFENKCDKYLSSIESKARAEFTIIPTKMNISKRKKASQVLSVSILYCSFYL